MMEEEEDEKLIDLKSHRQHQLISPKHIIRFVVIIGAMIFLFWKFQDASSGKNTQENATPQELDSNSISVEVDTLK